MFITFVICKITLRTTFDYVKCTVDWRNFSKAEEILFVKDMRLCVCSIYSCYFWHKMYIFILYNKPRECLLAKGVRRSSPTAGIPSGGRNVILVGFLGVSPVSPTTNFIPQILHTPLIHFISPCDVAKGVIGRHPCYSLIFNIGTSSDFILRPGPMSGRSWGEFL